MSSYLLITPESEMKRNRENNPNGGDQFLLNRATGGRRMRHSQALDQGRPLPVRLRLSLHQQHRVRPMAGADGHLLLPSAQPIHRATFTQRA